MNYLIVDLNVTLDGHKYGFVQNLIDFLDQYKSEHNFRFLVNDLKEISYSQQLNSKVKIEYKSLEDGQLSPIKKANLQWQEIKEVAERHKIDKCVLLEYDIYQLALAKSSFNFKVSGILFRPHNRLKDFSGKLLGKIKNDLVKLRKVILLKASLRNKNLHKVFVLNDQWLVDQTKSKHFAYLPDPVFNYKKEELNIKEAYRIGANKKVLLIFGMIDDRKNVSNILEALKKVENPKDLTLLIVGKFHENYKETLLKKIKEVEGTISVRYENNFVSDGKMESLFEQADLVLRMNVNFFASSGIIGQAAKYNKPLIVSNYGIVAELVEEYQLGWVIDPLNVELITSTINEFTRSGWTKTDKMQEFYLKHNREAFAKTLLELL